MGADPLAVGNTLLRARDTARGQELSFHEVADRLLWDRMPAYDPGESLASRTATNYALELKARAASGDRYAASMLLGQFNDDPGGS